MSIIHVQFYYSLRTDEWSKVFGMTHVCGNIGATGRACVFSLPGRLRFLDSAIGPTMRRHRTCWSPSRRRGRAPRHGGRGANVEGVGERVSPTESWVRKANGVGLSRILLAF